MDRYNGHLVLPVANISSAADPVVSAHIMPNLASCGVAGFAAMHMHVRYRRHTLFAF
jgi:hypothetical protein